MFSSRDPNGSRDLNVTRRVVMMVGHVTPADRIIPGGNQSRDMMSCPRFDYVNLILSYLGGGPSGPLSYLANLDARGALGT